MSFESASNYLIRAARRFGFHHQVGAGIVLEECRRFFAEHYSDQSKHWEPKKFVKGTLHIKTSSSASASSLYLYQSQILDDFARHECLQVVKDIQIEK